MGRRIPHLGKNDALCTRLSKHLLFADDEISIDVALEKKDATVGTCIDPSNNATTAGASHHQAKPH